ncbi:protein trichome birefringence-like 34 isoform X3 [Panicum miliaceum]|uniref:Protein trichome birefringence-like 34 isoform X3 n=1 Tax=Panicum miliaceum TaxID=4540 RepID=A0A3L6Q0P8_PANMI|nr:protein trichome birefringence-like 34 isoform X3 [Panicum miliaceum]
MTVLSSSVGLRSIINSLVAFSIIVISVTLLFYQGQEGQVPMAVEHEHQKIMQVQLEAEHHEQLRAKEAPVPLTAELPDASKEECNWSTGRWVYDNLSRPLYSGLKCAFIFPELSCDKYGSKDVMYQHWRWQPYGCDLPRFNATRLLEKLRNKRLVFVGDSLNRNQWVSLVCMVEASIPDNRLKMRVFNGSLISFKAFEYNATIDFYWSPLLVESNSDDPIIHRVEYRIIRADRIEKHANAWRDADIIIFNSYVWWRKHKADMKMKVMYGSFENGDARLEEVEMLDGFEIALKKLTEWLGENIDKNKTRIFFAGSSPTHSWASNWGGVDRNKCLNETEPIYKVGYKAADYSMIDKAKSYFGTLEQKGIRFDILNITELSDYRKDGHPTVFRKQFAPLTTEQMANPASYADCTHWCLPGVPDVWNEFLYGYLMYK